MKRINKRSRFCILLSLILLLIIGCSKKEISTIDLSGEWQFQMDPDDKGGKGKWFNQDLSETVRNPEWYNDPNYAPYIVSTLFNQNQ